VQFNFTAQLMQRSKVQHEAADNGQALPRRFAGAHNDAPRASVPIRQLLCSCPSLLSHFPPHHRRHVQLAKGSTDHTKLSNYEKADKGAGALAGDFARVVEEVMQLRCAKAPRSSSEDVDAQLTRALPRQRQVCDV
jgi:hypothetical protein